MGCVSDTGKMACKAETATRSAFRRVAREARQACNVDAKGRCDGGMVDAGVRPREDEGEMRGRDERVIDMLYVRTYIPVDSSDPL